jgi:hypothetical protein
VAITILPKPEGTLHSAAAPQGRLVIQQRASIPGIGMLRAPASLQRDAGAIIIPFVNGQGQVTLTV